MIIGMLVVALGYFAYDKFVLDPSRDAELMQTMTEAVTEQATESGNAETADKSIAVLPFVNMSDDASNEYFSDGISEEILNLLAKVPEMRVAARTSSFSFKDQNLEIPAIAERLNVAHVLEGSVRKAGSQIRITVQLIKADDGFHVWSETYDRTLDNIFQIQDEIAAAVVNALKVALLGKALKTRETDPKAYQLYLEGQYFGYQRTEESLTKAIELFKRALAIDPGYTPAWAELAYSYLWFVGMGAMPIDEGNALADQAIEMALSTDPDYAWTYFVRGASHLYNKFNFKAGIEDFQHALQLDPGNAFIVAAAGTGASVFGRFDEAIDHYLAALELDPVMAENLSFLGTVYLFSGRLDEAEAALRKTLALSPRFASARYRHGRVLLRQGKHSEALAELEQENSFVYRTTGLAMLHHLMGNHEESDRALKDLIGDAADIAAFQIAEVYGVRGEADEAFEWLEQSLVIRDSGLASLLGDPAFRGLIGDPRWIPFLEKLGLLDAWRAMPPEHGGPAR
jgi:TolB-like protein/thioredoxin-like negative regulator of GroEL